MLKNHIKELIKKILTEKGTGTQEELCSELKKEGFDINQSTVSRYLRKLGAIKTSHATGKTFYQLAPDTAIPSVSTPIAELVLSMTHNSTLIVIHTSPGSASLIARHLDHLTPGLILGTLAGDDTVFVAPTYEKEIRSVFKELKKNLLPYALDVT